MTSNNEEKTMLRKLEDTAPYNILFSKVLGVPIDQQENAVEFKDFLCPSLGKLKSSLQITGKVDFDWLSNEYEKQGLNKLPLTVVYEDEIIDNNEAKSVHLELTRCPVEITNYVKYGSHHSKIAIYLYEDNSLRIVVSTANLLKRQWSQQYSHGFWVSPPCPPLLSKSETKGESPSKFKSTLLNYLKKYNKPDLNDWIETIKSADLSNVKAVLIASVPGLSSNFHTPNSHLKQVRGVLQRNVRLNFEDEEGIWPIVAQVSSLGGFGEPNKGWLKDLVGGLNISNTSSNIEKMLQIVYPSVKNVENGTLGTDACKDAEGLRYDVNLHQSQKWIENILYEWKADRCGRTKIMPHTKIYCQFSPSYKKMAWFLLTSTNLSKGGWGQDFPNKRASGTLTRVRNFEAGVMLVPAFFQEEYFKTPNTTEVEVDQNVFPMIFDLPLTKYKKNDAPWTMKFRD